MSTKVLMTDVIIWVSRKADPAKRPMLIAACEVSMDINKWVK